MPGRFSVWKSLMKKFLFMSVLHLIVFPVSEMAQAGEPPLLTVRDFASGEVFLQLPVRYGQAFTIRYVHSVDRSPVFETFRVKKGAGLVLEETHFRMFGAGMGHWEGHGRLVRDGEWTRIEGINRELGGFVLRIGSKGVDHTVILGKQEINLSDMAAGRRAEVFVSEQTMPKDGLPGF